MQLTASPSVLGFAAFSLETMLAISAFTLEALLVIVTGSVSVLIFCMIITNPNRKPQEQKPMLALCAVALASVVIIGAITWATAFFRH